MKQKETTYGWVDEPDRFLPHSNASVIYHGENGCYHWSSGRCPEYWNKATFYLMLFGVSREIF